MQRVERAGGRRTPRRDHRLRRDQTAEQPRAARARAGEILVAAQVAQREPLQEPREPRRVRVTHPSS